MSQKEFIEQIAVYIKKHAGDYGIKVVSPIIAQACLESAYGTSELAKNAHNYFGLKFRKGRCKTCTGVYTKTGSEQNADGTYVSSVMQWCRFADMENGVIGYFDFININNYKNLKGVTDPKTYLENIKKDGYATSLKYVDNLMNVINKWDLTKYDGNSSIDISENESGKSAGESSGEKSSNEAFLVKVTASALNVRKGPGTNFNKSGTVIRDKGVYTIVSVSEGEGSASGWGKLKSGAGWISLDYTVRK